MSFEWFIGKRYLMMRPRQAFISLITVLSTAGVAVGVMVMIIVIAVMSGAESELKARLLGITAHGVVLRHGGPFSGYEKSLARIRSHPKVEAAMPYIYAQVMLRSSSGIAGSVLRGIDPETAGQVIHTLPAHLIRRLSVSEHPKPDASSVPAIILGKELASLLKVREGDTLHLVLPRPETGSTGHAPFMQRFAVAGIFESGLYEFDKSMSYTSLESAQGLIRQPKTATGIEVRVMDVDRAPAILREVIDDLGHPFWGQDWMQMNRNIFSALKLQKTVMFIILALITLVAAFNIASTLIMMVMEKTSDIAILKAMGATDASIRKIFVIKGMAIGVIGAATGMFLGFLSCFLIKRYKFITLPTDVYFFPFLPISLEARDVFVIVASTLLICLIATVYPSGKAAGQNPVDAFRLG